MSEYVTEQDKQSFRCFSLFHQDRPSQCSSDYIQPADKLGPCSGFVCWFVIFIHVSQYLLLEDYTYVSLFLTSLLFFLYFTSVLSIYMYTDIFFFFLFSFFGRAARLAGS